MSAGRGAVVLAGGALALGLTAWLAGLAGGETRATVPEPSAEAGPAREPVPPAPSGRHALGPAEAGTLRLRILRADGRPAKGHVLWLTTAAPPRVSTVLAPDEGYPLPARARSTAHEGSARLEIPPGHWTWLRATADGRPRCAAYVRVPPFAGEERRELRLDASRRTLHAFVLEPDLATPARRREVRLLATDLRTGGEPTPVAAKRTDAWGYVAFGDLPATGYLLCAPGASVGDPPPHVRRVVLPPIMEARDLPCTLVVPEARRRVRLRVLASFSPEGGVAPKLFFERFGRREGERFPVPGVVRPGRQELAVALPAGEYRLGVLPLGRLEVAGGRPLYTVPAGGEDPVVRLRLHDNPVETELTLRGIDGSHLPVTVFARPAGRVQTDDRGLLFCGPFRWHVTTLRVRAPRVPCFLVVSGAAGCWISERALRLRGGRVRVEVGPATRLRLEWFPEDLGARDGIMVDVATRRGTETLYLRKQLVERHGLVRPGLAASIVVPRGRVVLSWSAPPAGEEGWRQPVEADAPWRTVVLDAAGR